MVRGTLCRGAVWHGWRTHSPHATPRSYPLPRLYPTPEGRVLAEWRFGRQDVSLTVNLDGKTGEYERLHLDNEDCAEESIDLAEPAGWEHLNTLLNALRTEQVAAA